MYIYTYIYRVKYSMLLISDVLLLFIHYLSLILKLTHEAHI